MSRHVLVRMGRRAPLAGVMFSDDEDRWVTAIVGSTDYAESLRADFVAGVFEDAMTLERSLSTWVAMAPVKDWPADLPGADEISGAVENPPPEATWERGDVRRAYDRPRRRSSGGGGREGPGGGRPRRPRRG